MKDTTKQVIDPNTAKVGDTYDRNGYEVQYRLAVPRDAESAKWRRVMGKLNKTVEEARKVIRDAQKPEPALEIMIGRGPKMLYRIVKVTATVEIVEEVE